jgi:hypothetical protein
VPKRFGQRLYHSCITTRLKRRWAIYSRLLGREPGAAACALQRRPLVERAFEPSERSTTRICTRTNNPIGALVRIRLPNQAHETFFA